MKDILCFESNTNILGDDFAIDLFAKSGLVLHFKIDKSLIDGEFLFDIFGWVILAQAFGAFNIVNFL